MNIFVTDPDPAKSAQCLPELAVQYLTEAFKAAETTSQEYERI